MWEWVCCGKNIDKMLIICGINVDFKLNFPHNFSVLVKGTSTESCASCALCVGGRTVAEKPIAFLVRSVYKVGMQVVSKVLLSMVWHSPKHSGSSAPGRQFNRLFVGPSFGQRIGTSFDLSVK